MSLFKQFQNLFSMDYAESYFEMASGTAFSNYMYNEYKMERCY